jgi:uncharacterized spore protein YtfJ
MSTALNSNLEALFEKMGTFVTTKTVVGEPIRFDDVIIVPLVDVSFGVAAGSGAGGKSAEKDGGGAGAGGLGAKITPSAVIVIVNGTVQLVNVKSQDSVNKLIVLIPGVLSKLNFNFFKKKDNEGDTLSEGGDVKEELRFEKSIVTEDINE